MQGLFFKDFRVHLPRRMPQDGPEAHAGQNIPLQRNTGRKLGKPKPHAGQLKSCPLGA